MEMDSFWLAAASSGAERAADPLDFGDAPGEKAGDPRWEPGESGGDLSGDSATPEEFAGEELGDLASVLAGAAMPVET